MQRGSRCILKAVFLALDKWSKFLQRRRMTVAKFILALAAAAPFLLSSCSSITGATASPSEGLSNEQLIDYYPPRWNVNQAVYQEMKRGKGIIEIDQKELTLTLYDDAGQVAIKTDCSTGIDGRYTPNGNFTILEMIVDKRSNKYGKYVSKTTGEVVVEKSWEVPGPPPGTKYQGIAMPYWMRLTWDGVGIHVGKFPRGYRTSFGCIRMPEEVQPLIYQKCRKGMSVVIQ